MSLKLSPEIIRAQAAQIADSVSVSQCAAKIIELIEQATGEKLPEQIKHGSVWGDGAGTTLLVVGPTHNSEHEGFRVLMLQTKSHWSAMGSHTGEPETELRGSGWPSDPALLAQELEIERYRYLGQFDFSAGLPKGAPL